MVTAVADVAEARRKLACFVFDVMVLDVMMPGETGLSLLQSMAHEQHLPVLMLSAMGEAEDRIKGLEVGAEDYLAKPFEPKELVLRLRSILRRNMTAPKAASMVIFGVFQFDLESNRLTRDGELVSLTTGEQALLRALSESLGIPVSREALAARMPGGVTNERSVDVQITRLRKKIEERSGQTMHLQTVRGAGYVLYGRQG